MKFSLTYDDIHRMVSETVSRVADRRGLLSEITSSDAYERFYKGKIAPSAYQELMRGTKNMTPFHKLCLDRITKRFPEADEGWESNPPYKIFVKRASRLWNNSSPEARQIIIRLVKEDYDFLFHKGTEMFTILERYANMRYKTVADYENNGLVVLFDSPAVRITCTTTYASSCHFFGKSRWCTASDRGGNHDGFEFFRNYSSMGPLVQFCNKEDENCSYQVNFDIDTMQPGQVCDWNDNSVEFATVLEMLRSKGLNCEEVMNKYVYPRLTELRDETMRNLNDEFAYYRIAGRRKAVAFCKTVDGLVCGKKAKEFAIDLANGGEDGYNEDATLYGWETYRESENLVVVVIKVADINENSEHYESFREFRRGNLSFYQNYGMVPHLQAIYVVKDGKIVFYTDGYIYHMYQARIALITDIPSSQLGVKFIVDIETGNVLAMNVHDIFIPSDADFLIRHSDYASEMARKMGTESDREWIAYGNPDRKEELIFLNCRSLKTFKTSSNLAELAPVEGNDLPY